MRAAIGIIYLAVAQLVEHGIVVVNNIPVVPGSNPGGEIVHQQQKNNIKWCDEKSLKEGFVAKLVKASVL